MNVLRHQDVAGNHKAIPHPDGLKFPSEDSAGRGPAQQRLATITTERYKVKTAALLVMDEPGHDGEFYTCRREERFVQTHPSAKNAEGWGTHSCRSGEISKTWVRHPPVMAHSGEPQ
jgi:hypothetical protein